MTKKLRSGFLLFTGLAMVLWSIGGCASSGRQAGSTEDYPLEPTAESLGRLPEGTVLDVELESGVVLTGAFETLSAGATAMDLRVNEAAEALAPEFVEEGDIYRIALDSIANLALVEA